MKKTEIKAIDPQDPAAWWPVVVHFATYGAVAVPQFRFDGPRYLVENRYVRIEEKPPGKSPFCWYVYLKLGDMERLACADTPGEAVKVAALVMLAEWDRIERGIGVEPASVERVPPRISRLPK